jgi:hypothetical protein
MDYGVQGALDAAESQEIFAMMVVFSKRATFSSFGGSPLEMGGLMLDSTGSGCFLLRHWSGWCAVFGSGSAGGGGRIVARKIK